jgi:hypothetical protein
VTRAALVVAAVLGVVTGCTHGTKEQPNADADQDRRPPSAATRPEGDATRAPLPWQQTVALPKSRSTRRFNITAPDPANHAFAFRIKQRPAAAQVFVKIKTSYGDLTVFDPNVQPFVSSEAIHCEDQGSSRDCLMRFPSLVAERAGRWTVVVEKLSDGPAEVRVEVEFSRVAAGAGTVSGDQGLASKERFDQNGIAFNYPHRWSVTVQPLSPATNPVYRFAVSSVPVQQTAADEGPCLPGVARQLPSGAVLAYLREALGADRTRSLPRMPQRPASFPLAHRTGGGLCGFAQGGGLWYPFKDGNRAFYLGVYVGPDASTASRRALKDLLDGIEVRAQ